MFQIDVDQQESETLLIEIVCQKTCVPFMEDHYFNLHGVAGFYIAANVLFNVHAIYIKMRSG